MNITKAKMFLRISIASLRSWACRAVPSKQVWMFFALLVGMGLNLAGPASAQTLTTLHSFTASVDGGYPAASLVLSGNTLYGTTRGAGSDFGTVFAVNANGSGFTTLHTFTNGSDGGSPKAGLVLSGNTLYGTAGGGGSSDNGTVFAVNTDGTGFTTLYSFTGGSDGENPEGELVLSGNVLYGTTARGGDEGFGTVFSVNTNGTGITTLYGFTNGSDGAYPQAGLILSGNTLYGTATEGGNVGEGTAFAITTNGTGFTTVYSFTGGADGGNPVVGVILSGNTLYGSTVKGGSAGDGTVFAINTESLVFTTLYGFTNGSDGAYPQAGLILSGNTLYGTATEGGNVGDGTVFAVNTDGTGFTTLHSFSGGSDEAFPDAALIRSGNTLYGTTFFAGSGRDGTVFSLSLPGISAPQLSITVSGANVVLTWPSLATGFTLQSTATLDSPGVWNTNLPLPVVVGEQNTVTNPISGTQQFYQLSQ
jgi:uncharacterized repeat protein (TIGR03803 family)